MNASQIRSFSSSDFNDGAKSSWLNPTGEQSKGSQAVRFIGRLGFGFGFVTASAALGVFYHLGKAFQAFWNSRNTVDSESFKERGWKHLHCAFEDGMTALIHITALAFLGLCFAWVPQMHLYRRGQIMLTVSVVSFLLSGFRELPAWKFARDPNSFKINEPAPAPQQQPQYCLPPASSAGPPQRRRYADLNSIDSESPEKGIGRVFGAVSKAVKLSQMTPAERAAWDKEQAEAEYRRRFPGEGHMTGTKKKTEKS